MIVEIAADTRDGLTKLMRNSPFTVSTDRSNDTAKLFPLAVRTVDPVTQTVRSDPVAVPTCESSATGNLN